MAREPGFEIAETAAVGPSETLFVGLADPGVAGLTATDYLVTHANAEQVGHVITRNLPDITPFSAGRPRHPMRLYALPEADATALVGEVLLPAGVADPFADALLSWASGKAVEEVTVLHGAPFPHSEAEHAAFHVATDDYRRRHFPADANADDGGPDDESETGSERGGIPPLAGGFFDGVIGELLVRALDGGAPPTGVLLTPAHLPGPDFDAALRLLDAVETVYGFQIEEAELAERSAEMKRYYQELAERVAAIREAEGAGERDYFDDRMYM